MTRLSFGRRAALSMLMSLPFAASVLAQSYPRS